MNTRGRVRRRFHRMITGWYELGYIPCCVYCGKQFYSRDGITVDHRVPLKLGGKNEEENLVPSCFSCNVKKGHRIVHPKFKEKVKRV